MPAALIVYASPMTTEIEVETHGWMKDERLTESIRALLRNIYAVRQLQQPFPDVIVSTAPAIERKPGKGTLYQSLERLAWKVGCPRGPCHLSPSHTQTPAPKPPKPPPNLPH